MDSPDRRGLRRTIQPQASGPNGRWLHKASLRAPLSGQCPATRPHEDAEGRRNGRCIMETRRRLDRRSVGWAASYRLAGEPGGAWRDCRVVDISMLGLGITFDHPNPAELSGRLISVNLPGDGSCVNVRLEGEIRNATATMGRDHPSRHRIHPAVRNRAGDHGRAQRHERRLGERVAQRVCEEEGKRRIRR